MKSMLILAVLPVTVLPGFSCLHATIAWACPHRLGHTVFQLPLIQICKVTCACLSSPFSHARLVSACQLGTSIITTENIHTTYVV